MNTLTLEAPETIEPEAPIHTLYQPTTLTFEDETIRRQAHKAVRTRFQQVVFASQFARIARQVRKGTLAPHETLDAVQRLVASVACQEAAQVPPGRGA